eukprot:6203245-Pleurochrysis_carterae.AAC.7
MTNSSLLPARPLHQCAPLYLLVLQRSATYATHLMPYAEECARSISAQPRHKNSVNALVSLPDAAHKAMVFVSQHTSRQDQLC